MKKVPALNQVIKKVALAPKIKMVEVRAPEVALKAKPGQFVIIRIDESGERVPLTLADGPK